MEVKTSGATPKWSPTAPSLPPGKMNAHKSVGTFSAARCDARCMQVEQKKKKKVLQVPNVSVADTHDCMKFSRISS
jgi:hypothetical protein